LIHDQYKTGRIAAEHLISLSHKRIAYLAMPETSYAGRQRKRALPMQWLKPKLSLILLW